MLKLYLISPNTYYVSGKTKFNWILDRWDDLLIDLYGAPNKEFNIKLTSGKKLTIETALDKENEYRATDLLINYKSKRNSLRYTLSVDTNKWIKDELYIRYSNISLKFIIGNEPLYEWSIQSDLRYDTNSQSNHFDIGRYEWQTIGIEKNEHRRKMKLSFNRLAKSFSFIYTILAFDKDPIEIHRNQDNWKIGGRFDKGSEERF